MPAARTKPNKWIAKEIAGLDPEIDYERIWKLATMYYPTEFSANLSYILAIPKYMVPLHAAETVFRNGSGKVYKRPVQRMEDSLKHTNLWWENGPNSPVTRKSVDVVNRLHSHYARKYPGHFGCTEDYIYALCDEGTTLHRLRLRLGMKGLSEKEQRASWEFWSRMCPLFVNAETQESLDGFPENFAEMNRFVEEYEAIDRPAHHLSEEVDKALIGSFVEHQFPRPLRPFGRALVLSLLPDATVQAHRLARPNRIVGAACRLLVRCVFTLGERILPDPEYSFLERREMKKISQASSE